MSLRRVSAICRLLQRQNNRAERPKPLFISDLSVQATGPQLGMLLGAFVSVVGGLIVALLGSWKLTLVTLAFMPILLIGGMITSRVVTDLSKKDTESDGISSAGQVSFSYCSKWYLKTHIWD